MRKTPLFMGQLSKGRIYLLFLLLTGHIMLWFYVLVPFLSEERTTPEAEQKEEKHTTTTTTSRIRLSSSTIAAMKIRIFIPDSVEVFYSKARGDRSGAAILDMLMAHAFAWTLGRKYGGVCGPIHPVADDHRRMIRVLGLQDELPYPLQPESCEALVNGTGDNNSNSSNNSTNITKYLVLARRVYMKWKDTNIFTPEWIEYMQQQRRRNLQPRPSSTRQSQQDPHLNNKQRRRIIIHIRRGDVSPCIHDFLRYTPNSHYIQLINQYTMSKNSGGLDNGKNMTIDNVTIYSESQSFESWESFNVSMGSKVAYSLSLDRDMAHIWRDMLGLDDDDDDVSNIHRILILSLSSFSIVPAILANASTTTVIYTPFWHKPLPHWQVVTSNIWKASVAKTRRLRRQHCPSKKGRVK